MSQETCLKGYLPMDTMDRAALAAKSDAAALENFIKENQRFILICASRASRRFVTVSDDEWSVGLMAFHEAVESFDEGKGSFKSFASLIIKRRVVDYIRSEQRHAAELPVEPEAMTGEVDPEGASALQLEVRDREAAMAKEHTKDQPGTSAARDEIDAVQQTLEQYGFSFFDLTTCSPKAGKTKEQCARALEILLGDAKLLDRMRGGRSLPIKELARNSGISRKVLERHRKYIIAAAEILSGDYPILGGYLSGIRKAVT